MIRLYECSIAERGEDVGPRVRAHLVDLRPLDVALNGPGAPIRCCRAPRVEARVELRWVNSHVPVAPECV